MTEALYLHDSYINEFTANVVSSGNREIILDATAFYPSSGGQPNDTGTIHLNGTEASFNVVDVVKKNGQIVHVVDSDGLSPGDNVTGEINWSRRYVLMRMHTAAHILSSVFNKESGVLITGNQLGVDKSRIDFNMEIIDREKINNYIEAANKIIAENIAIEMTVVKREDALKIPDVVKLAGALPPNIPELRLVKIGSYDLQADGGCHVNNTSEIGKIELISVENKGKTNRRIYYKVI
ncbi:MAG: alanyl-tRNA editing protein [Candidatus Aenigmarchaeota archaeon]|nr:alanyl-tRNA editing protein [Candidatus Aenigmarchaeota archaeon]